MRTAFYWWRTTYASTWRATLALALIGGLLGAVALGAVAGARRTASAYGRYLTSSNASDAMVNVPGTLPGAPVAYPMTLISRLPGVTSGAAYIGLAAVIGIPLGVAAGRWAWQAFAGSLGVAPVTVIPVPALVLGVGVLLAAGNLLALVPAAAAARIPPGITLRAE